MKPSCFTAFALHGRSELGLAPDEYAALTMVLLRLLAFKPAGERPAPAEKKTLKSPSLQAAASPTQTPDRPQPLPAASLAAPAPVASNQTAMQGAVANTAVPPHFDENRATAQIDQAQKATESVVNTPYPAGQRLPIVTMPSPLSETPVLTSNQPVAHVTSAIS